MKQLLLAFCALCMTLPVFADTWLDPDTGYRWTYTLSDGKAILGSSGHSPAVDPAPSGHIDIPETLGGLPVTVIGDYAFSGCNELTSVTIPAGVTSIGASAFSECTALASVQLPDGLTSIGASAFDWCLRLTAVTFPKSLTEIAEGAFFWSGLTSASLPEGVMSIGSDAFGCCRNLVSVVIPSTVTVIEDYTFRDCRSLQSVNIPRNVVSIGRGAFDGCWTLTAVAIHAGVTEIGDGAFSRCNNVWIDVDADNPNYKSMEGALFSGDGKTLLRVPGGVSEYAIPQGVTVIGIDAFSGCQSLRAVTIPFGVTTIESGAFYRCLRLASVAIPDSVTSIGDTAFVDCSDLVSVTLPRTSIHLGANVFDGCTDLPTDEFGVRYESSERALLVQAPSHLSGAYTIPDTVRYIHSYAFAENSELTSVTIPEGVISIGDSAFSGCVGLTSIKIPGSVISVGNYAFYRCQGLSAVEISEGVQELGFSAFSACAGLTSVTIPGSVDKIERYAFAACTNLMSVTLIDGVTTVGDSAFSDCSGLTSVTIPESVTSIGGGAFSGCSGLTSVSIPGSVTSLGASAFSGCSGLGSVVLSEGVTSIGESAFSGCSRLTSVTIPGSVDQIERYTFLDCKALTSVTLPNGLTSIGEYAFDNCYGLTSLTFPDGLSAIGDGAFWGCYGLTSVTFPEGLTTIGEHAFWDCYGLTSLTLPEGLTSIGADAFSGCSGLTSVTIPESVVSIGYHAFSSCSGLRELIILPSEVAVDGWAFSDCTGLTAVTVSAALTTGQQLYFPDSDGLTTVKIVAGGTMVGDLFSECSSLSTVTIGEGVTSIGNSAFSGCTGLTSVTFPEGLVSIGNYAFSRCGALSSVTLPSSVTSVGDYAFSGCGGLLALALPEGMTSIGQKAFDGCAGLTSVAIPKSVTFIGDFAFSGCGGLTSVTIPARYTEDKTLFAQSPNLTEVTVQADVGGATVGAAFSGCASLERIVFSEGVKCVGHGALEGCVALKDVEFPDSLTEIASNAFAGCIGLTSLRIPESVTTLGAYAFSGCTGLTAITIPVHLSDSDTSGAYGVFSGCDNLTELLLLGGGTDLGTLFAGLDSLTSVAIPEGVTAIADGAFAGCSALVSVSMLEGVTSIGSRAFDGCSSLASLVLPASLTDIGYSAFRNCTALKNLTVPACVTAREGIRFVYAFSGEEELRSVLITGEGALVGDAFAGYGMLGNVTIGEGVTAIADGAFSNCGRMESVLLPDSLETIGQGAFSSCGALPRDDAGVQYESAARRLLIDAPETLADSYIVAPSVRFIHSDAFKDCRELTAVTFPEGLEAIGASAFRDCYALTSAILPETVKVIGEGAFEWCKSLQEVAVPSGVKVFGKSVFSSCSSLQAVTFGEGLEMIGEAAFKGCSALTAVTIPASVTSIGAAAFKECTGLTSVSIPTGVTVLASELFAGCTGLTSVTMPEGLTAIGISAFDGCTGLTSVTIPEGVTTIGGNAFARCAGLTSVTIPEGVTTIGEGAFRECSHLVSVAIPEGVTTVEHALFYGCAALTEVTLPKGVTSVGPRAFGRCYELKSVTIPEGVTSIGLEAFDQCSDLTRVTLPDGLTDIGDRAFGGCVQLSSIVLPDSIRNIGSSAFSACADLTSIILPEGLEMLGYAAFSYCNGLTSITIPSTVKDYESAFTDCKNLKSVTILNGVTRISSNAFNGCSSLASVAIPESVTIIEEGAFSWCTALTSVSIPEGVTVLGSYVFYNCIALTSLRIPDGVTRIEVGSFNKCQSLTSVSIPESVTFIGEQAFQGCSGLTTLMLPEGLTEIGPSAFSGATGLTTVIIPEGVTTIGHWGFAHCQSLVSVSLPASLTALRDSAFEGCVNLKSVLMPRGLTYIGNLAFRGCSSLTSVSIPDTVQELGDGIFADCYSLEAVSLPAGITTIGSTFFFDCRSLTSVTIPESVTNIGGFAFSYCSALTSITIPARVSNLDSGAFAYSAALRNIYFLGAPPRASATCFSGLSADAMGYYEPSMREEWEPVLDAERKWYGLPMEDAKFVSSGVDLAVESVEVPASVTVGQTATVAWTVTNVGSVAATGVRHDRLALINAQGQEVPLGAVGVMESLGAGESRRQEWEVIMPPVNDGEWSLKVTANADREIFEGDQRANNVGFPAASVAVTVETLEPGSHGVSLSPGAWTLFRVMPSADPLSLTLSETAGLAAQFSALPFGGIPEAREAARTFTVGTLGGWLYLENRTDITRQTDVTIGSRLGLIGLSPTLIEPKPQTLEVLLSGVGFEPGMICRLAGSLGCSGEGRVTACSATEATVRFEGVSPAEGEMLTVSLSAAGQQTSLADAIAVAAPQRMRTLEAELELPAGVRDGRIYTGALVYRNPTDRAMMMPIFKVTAQRGAKLALTREALASPSPSLVLCGISEGEEAGILPPGAEGRVSFLFLTEGGTDPTIAFATFDPGAQQPLDSRFATASAYAEAMSRAATALNRTSPVAITDGAAVSAYAVLMAEGVRDGRLFATLYDTVRRCPLADVTVRLVDEASGETAATVTTDAEGRFVAGYLPHGTYRLESDAIATVMPASVDVRGAVAGGVFSVTPMPYVYGRVVGGEPAQPIAGAEITVGTPSGRTWRTRSDANGFYHIYVGQPTTLKITVDGQALWLPQTQALSWPDAGNPAVKADFRLTPGAMLQGALSGDLASLAPASVALVNQKTGDVVILPVDAEGSFASGVLPAGTYQVTTSDRTRYQMQAGTAVELVAGVRTERTFAIEPPPVAVYDGGPHFAQNVARTFVGTRPVMEMPEWDFDGDGTVDSTEASPSYAFAELGTFVPTVTYTDASGNRIRESLPPVEVVPLLNSLSFKDNVYDLTAEAITVTPLEDGYLIAAATSPIAMLSGQEAVGPLDARTSEAVVQGNVLFLPDTAAPQMVTRVEAVDEGLKVATRSATAAELFWDADLIPSKALLSHEIECRVLDYTDTCKNDGSVEGENANFTWSGDLKGSITVSYYITLRGKVEMLLTSNDAHPVELTESSIDLWAEAGGSTVCNVEGNGSVSLSDDFVERFSATTVAVLPVGTLKVSVSPQFEVTAEGTCTLSKPFSLTVHRQMISGALVVPPDALTRYLPEPEITAEGALSVESGLRTELALGLNYFKLQEKFLELDVARVGLTTLCGVELDARLTSVETEPLECAVTPYAELTADFDFLHYRLLETWEDSLFHCEQTYRMNFGEWEYVSPMPAIRAVCDPMTPSVRLYGDVDPEEGAETVLERKWDFGDGTAAAPTAAAWIDHVYAIPNNALDVPTYTVTLSHFIQSPYRLIPDHWRTALAEVTPQNIHTDFGSSHTDLGPGQGGATLAAPTGVGSSWSPTSWDPNEMSGPAGVGERRLVQPGDWLTYTVYFENKAEASASAQEVRVTQQLDASLDWSTFEILEVVYRNQTENGLNGKASGTAESELSGTPYKVRTTASYDTKTGSAYWYLRIVDERTPDQWPEDVYVGILPPNNAEHDGEGHITYRVKVREDAADGARIDSTASIVFDTNEAIETDPAWWNTVAYVIDTVSFAAREVSGDGPDGYVSLQVLGGSDTAATSVDLHVLGGTMVNGTDYYFPDTMTLTWAQGDRTPKTLLIPFNEAAVAMGDKTLEFGLTNASGLALDAIKTCTVTFVRHIPALTWPETEEPSEALAAWVTEGAARNLIADGPLVLADGVTMSALETAHALGIFPEFTHLSGGGAMLDISVLLNVAEVMPPDRSDDGSLVVTARIVAEKGSVAEPYEPTAAFVLEGGPTLDMVGWTEMRPGSVEILTGRTAQEARLRLRFPSEAIPSDTYFLRISADAAK